MRTIKYIRSKTIAAGKATTAVASAAEAVAVARHPHSTATSRVNHNYDRKILYNYRSSIYIEHFVVVYFHCGFLFCTSIVLPTKPERGAQIKFTLYKGIYIKP